MIISLKNLTYDEKSTLARLLSKEASPKKLTEKEKLRLEQLRVKVGK